MMKIAVYKAEIEQLCWRLRERFQSDCIILHGSVARGTHTLKSDVDIIVVGGNLADNFFTRLYELSELRDGKTPFEIVGYTLQVIGRSLSPDLIFPWDRAYVL
jgi:predicted nucleotidyltransferase